MIVTSSIRLLGLGVCVYGLSSRKLPQNIASERYSFPHSMVYITNIGLVVTFASLFMGLLTTICGTTDTKKRRGWASRMHNILAVNSVGLETIVTLGFWTLYAIDPKNVTSMKIKKAGYSDPMAKQLAMHVFPFFFALHEGWMARPQRSLVHHAVLFVVTLLYYVISRKVATARGKWQYSFLDRMSERIRITVIMCFMALGQASIETFIFVRRRAERAWGRVEDRIKLVPMIKLSTKILFLAFCLYGYSDYGTPQEIVTYTSNLVAGKYLYLTTQGLLLTIATLMLGLFQHSNDTRPTNGVRKWIRSTYLSLLLVTLPLEIIIFLVYWPLHIMCPEKLRPVEFVKNKIAVSLFSDFCLHLFPLTALLLEIYERNIEKSKLHLFVFVLFALFYYGLCREIAKVNNTWPYPFLNGMTEWQRLLFYAGITLAAVLFYEVIAWLKGRHVPVHGAHKDK
ncbi:UNVERIFIED_CONTAM: hypothetical protein PYX00_011600 [Menopon gallinae]|uniref:Uncharacterized protein n=1 Tax=Menopon gallinae TaxID=328185 RepID=A0AAW2H801_9NEOP